MFSVVLLLLAPMYIALPSYALTTAFPPSVMLAVVLDATFIALAREFDVTVSGIDVSLASLYLASTACPFIVVLTVVPFRYSTSETSDVNRPSEMTEYVLFTCSIVV